MTQDEARAWMADRFPGSIAPLDQLLTLLADEATRQNLVSASSLSQAWSRHVVDSAQLVPLAADPSGAWLDIGSGAGFPGLVLGIVTGAPITCVEPRARRVEWLRAAVDQLGLSNVAIAHASLAHLPTRPFATVTARAVAALPRLFEMSARFAAPGTRWLFPKGTSAAAELDEVRPDWQGVFHVEQSVTDPDAGIVVADRIARKRTR